MENNDCGWGAYEDARIAETIGAKIDPAKQTQADQIASLERRLAAAISLIETMVEHEAKILENSGMHVIAQQVRERIALMKE